MPAVSKAQRKLMGLAEHHPDQVSARNRSVLTMNLADMAHFASTPEKGLPRHVRKPKKGRR